tara:strand:- start:4392 stop:4739 length:348 start_codon:yes stop_codon:yes gene_type:complete
MGVQRDAAEIGAVKNEAVENLITGFPRHPEALFCRIADAVASGNKEKKRQFQWEPGAYYRYSWYSLLGGVLTRIKLWGKYPRLQSHSQASARGFQELLSLSGKPRCSGVVAESFH